MSFRLMLTGFVLSLALGASTVHGDQAQPRTDPSFFPIGVWLQSPTNASRYKAAGINTYVALWQGPSDSQLDALKAAGMKVVCRQNETALRRKDDPTILAWMHNDEPDNAQSKRGGGYGPPVPPEEVLAGYRRMKEKDPSRPVLLNLGQGVAWDAWVGRGVRTRHPEDYAEYVKGCDIASFDIYPATHENAAVAGKLWYVPSGVARLCEWAGPQRTVWNCIEASRIGNEKTKPTASQIRSEVWMSIIHGSRGIIYFVHQFKPNFVEASLLQDEELLRGVTVVNAQLRELAPVINSPGPRQPANAETGDPEAPVAAMTRRIDGSTYVFAAAMRDRAATAVLNVTGMSKGTAVVLGESRTVPIREGKIQDRFEGYQVHLYRCR